MHNFHNQLLDQITSAKHPVDQEFLANYLGNADFKYGLRVPELRRIAKAFYREHKDLVFSEIENLLNELYHGQSYEEKNLASELLRTYTAYRLQFNLNKIYDWLELLHGWAEVDNLCQNNFSVEEILARWSEWEVLLTKLNKSDLISHRRASIVLTVHALARSNNSKLFKLAFENIDRVKHEKDVMITKAISWALRGAGDTDPQFVRTYITKNIDSLPKIAVRETLKKLNTGKK